MRNLLKNFNFASREMLVILFFIITVILIILFIPINLLEYLSLNVVGEPPINGRTWFEGMWELGGESGMKIMAILGIIILGLCIKIFLNWNKISFNKREVKIAEILAFFGTTCVFFIINLLIGYAWWDPNAFLGIGSLFIPSIISLVIVGLSPEIYRIIFKLEKENFSISRKNFNNEIIVVILGAFGYGAVSCLWHCCSIFNLTMYFFFFVIKFIQLWAMTSFFFKWGFKMFLNKVKPVYTYLIIAICFGFTYPWHTFGFAITFTIFGLLLCEITHRTDSYYISLFLLYFAYIFHAALPWHGTTITLFVIIPISIIMISIFIILFILKPEKFKILSH